MNLRIDVIINFIALSIFAYILSKTLLPALYEWLYEKFTGHPLKRDVDLDELILKKKNMLQSGTGLVTAKSTTVSNSQTTSDDFLSHLKSFSNDEKLGSDVKKSITLLESLQWGDASELRDLSLSIEREIGQKITSNELTQNLKEMLQNKFFNNFNEKPMSYKSIISLLKNYSVFNSIEANKIPSIWKKELQCNDLDIKNALILLLYYPIDKRNEAFQKYGENAILSDNNGTPATIAYLKLIRELAPSYSLVTLKEKLKESIFILKAIGHLPELNKNDKNSALKLLMLDESADNEEIKKQYKKLAKTFHPDVLSGQGVPKSCIERATENFSKIKNAYEFLIK